MNTKALQEITDKVAGKVGMPAGGQLRLDEYVMTDDLREVPYVFSFDGYDEVVMIEVDDEDWDAIAALEDGEA